MLTISGYLKNAFFTFPVFISAIGAQQKKSSAQTKVGGNNKWKTHRITKIKMQTTVVLNALRCWKNFLT